MRNKAMVRLFLVAILLGTVVSVFASASPDGLERVMEDLHIKAAPVASGSSPLPDYAVPGVSSRPLAQSLAGLIGTVVALGVAWGLVSLLARPKHGHGPQGGTGGQGRP